jgi:hypothetical protein
MKWRELKQQIDDLDGVSDETEVVMMTSGNAADDVEAVHSLTSAGHRATVILSGIAEDDDPETWNEWSEEDPPMKQETSPTRRLAGRAVSRPPRQQKGKR